MLLHWAIYILQSAKWAWQKNPHYIIMYNDSGSKQCSMSIRDLVMQWALDVCCQILLLATALHTINVLCSPYIPSSHHWLHIKKGVWSHNICFIFFWQIQQREIRGGSFTCLCDKKLYIFLTNSTPASAKENINHHCRKMSVTDFSVAFKPFIIPPQRKSAKYKSAI